MNLIKALKCPLGETPSELRETDYSQIPCAIRDEFLLELLLKTCSELARYTSLPKRFRSTYHFLNKPEPKVDAQSVFRNLFIYCNAPENFEKRNLLKQIVLAQRAKRYDILLILLEQFFDLFGGDKFKAICFANIWQFCVHIGNISDEVKSNHRFMTLPRELMVSGLDAFYHAMTEFPSTEAFHFPRMAEYSLKNERGFIYEKVEYLVPEDFDVESDKINLSVPTERMAVGGFYLSDDRARFMQSNSFDVLNAKVWAEDALSVSLLLLSSMSTFHGYIDLEDVGKPLLTAADSFSFINLEPLNGLSDYDYKKLVCLCLSYGSVNSAMRLIENGLNDGRNLGVLSAALEGAIRSELNFLDIHNGQTEGTREITDRLNSMCANVIGLVNLEPSHLRPLVNLHLGVLFESTLFDVTYTKTPLNELPDEVRKRDSELSHHSNRFLYESWFPLFAPLRSQNSKSLLEDIFKYLIIKGDLSVEFDEPSSHGNYRLKSIRLGCSRFGINGAFTINDTLFLTGSFLWEDVIEWLLTEGKHINVIRLIAVEEDESKSGGRYARCHISDFTVRLCMDGKKLMSLTVNSNTYDCFGSKGLDWKIEQTIIESVYKRWEYIESRCLGEAEYLTKFGN